VRSDLDVLLDKVEDPILRTELQAKVRQLAAKRSYGLVFESHLPERVRLPDHPIRRGSTVVYRRDPASPSYLVQRVQDDRATIRRIRHPDGSSLLPSEAGELHDEDVALADLVAITDFGDPIFPGLRSVGSIARGGDKPSHVVINAENHHALRLLQFTHAGRVDCIYIDPPYNSGGAKDWKYDNNYVDQRDSHRHSKWLAFMERRLLLAKHLMNPDRSVLVVAIDEKEYLRLGLLLEQLFQGTTVQMVTTVIKPEGTGRANEFSRTNEFLYFVLVGAAEIQATPDNMFDSELRESTSLEWRDLRRRERTSIRGSRPRQFYAVFVDEESGKIHSVGDPLADEIDRSTVARPPGTRAVFPLNPSGAEMIWSTVPTTLRDLVDRGFARASTNGIQFLARGTVSAIERGDIEISGRDERGAVVGSLVKAKNLMPKTVWARESHASQPHGTLLLNRFVPGSDFPFPKSLYAVEDVLRFFVAHLRDAVIVDFFGGSGTTAHAVARLNRQDGGSRQAILVTNNEVSAVEAERLRSEGFQPGDEAWEACGIFESVTRPRLAAALTGSTSDGEPVKGDYKFTDEFPMAEGFEENVEFLDLSYLDRDQVELGRSFADLAAVLWLRVGAQGPVITAPSGPGHHAWTHRYGVLLDTDGWRAFVDQRPDTATAAFIVTDSQETFAGIAKELPDGMDIVRLHDSYLTAFDRSLSTD
jgi:adenine-specific DNA-methyltransferase